MLRWGGYPAWRPTAPVRTDRCGEEIPTADFETWRRKAGRLLGHLPRHEPTNDGRLESTRFDARAGVARHGRPFRISGAAMTSWRRTAIPGRPGRTWLALGVVAAVVAGDARPADGRPDRPPAGRGHLPGRHGRQPGNGRGRPRHPVDVRGRAGRGPQRVREHVRRGRSGGQAASGGLPATKVRRPQGRSGDRGPLLGPRFRPGPPRRPLPGRPGRLLCRGRARDRQAATCRPA